jgi:hypothetical protein
LKNSTGNRNAQKSGMDQYTNSAIHDPANKVTLKSLSPTKENDKNQREVAVVGKRTNADIDSLHAGSSV